MKNLTWRFDAQARGLNPTSTEPYLDNFVAELVASGYARLSIDNYAMSIAHFGDWLRRSGMSIDDIDERVIARFARSSRNSPTRALLPALRKALARRWAAR